MGLKDKLKLSKRVENFEEYFDVLFEKRNNRYYQFWKLMNRNNSYKRIKLMLSGSVG